MFLSDFTEEAIESDRTCPDMQSVFTTCFQHVNLHYIRGPHSYRVIHLFWDKRVLAAS